MNPNDNEELNAIREGVLTGELNRDQADEAQLLQLALPRTRA